MSQLGIEWTQRVESVTPRCGFSHRLIFTPQPHDGPVSITVEFKVDCAHGQEFVDLMRKVRLIHMRNGAYSWQMLEDLTYPNTFRLEMIVPSWNEHQLQKERMTKAEKELLERAWSLHTGTTQPEDSSGKPPMQTSSRT
jgi:hypothetical protein